MGGLSLARWRRDREAIAILLAVVWALAVLILPGVHLVRHDALGRHDHEPARAAETHCHHGHCHEEAPTPAGDDQPEHEDRDHGDGSLAHFGVALLAPPDGLFPFGAVVVAEIALPFDAVTLWARSVRGSARARAPPRSS